MRTCVGSGSCDKLNMATTPTNEEGTLEKHVRTPAAAVICVWLRLPLLLTDGADVAGALNESPSAVAS